MNKIDLITKETVVENTQIVKDLPTVSVSAKTGEGTRKLRSRIVQAVYDERDFAKPDVEKSKIISESAIQSLDQES
jgi:50S ribosomal subunit-associated GTPase HflX